MPKTDFHSNPSATRDNFPATEAREASYEIENGARYKVKSLAEGLLLYGSSSETVGLSVEC